MTCIVAVKDNGFVYFGADKQTTEAGLKKLNSGKLFRVGKLVIGSSGLTRVCNILNGNKEIAALDPTGKTPTQFVEDEFIPILKRVIAEQRPIWKRFGIGKSDVYFALLVASGGWLCEIGCDFATIWPEHEEWAIGSGRWYALGSFDATAKMKTDVRIDMALHAACRFDAGCSGQQFVKISTEPTVNNAGQSSSR